MYANTPLTQVCDCPVSGTEHPKVVEAEGAEQEMTEEEWTRRVAELNLHQVWIGTYKHTHTRTVSHKKHTQNTCSYTKKYT